jgi:2-polyprenyl-3-methyl-5-hydroxy-6-metoxy-1,4-benzoquinol methylase
MSMDDLAGRKALIKTSGLKAGRILDIGMGDCGCISFFLAKRGFEVIGIDHSPNAVHNSRIYANPYLIFLSFSYVHIKDLI